MNLQAIYHKPESNYCFAAAQKELTLRIRFAKGEELDSVAVLYNTKYHIAENQLRRELRLTLIDDLFDYYSATLQLADSRVSYVFEITVKGKTYYYCEDGLIDRYDFDFAYFNSFQFAYIHDSDVIKSVDWLTNAVFYQIFVDRFYKASDKDESYINAEWGDMPTPKSFYGGDLDGIRVKLPYIKALGVNAIYLTPIFKSCSNHKYNISDYYRIDEAFGGEQALERLVNACRENGIKVVLDAVFNHVNEDFAPFADVIKNGKTSRYYDWFVINGDSVSDKRDNYERFADCSYMPKLNTDNPEVMRYCLDVALYWTKRYGIDGWRLDVSDEVSHRFWRSFRQELKSVSPDCALIGENWHDSSSYLNGDQFDSIMNYAVTKCMMDFWANESIGEQELADRLSRQLARYSDVTNGMMFNLLDCHDTHRFYTLTGCNENKFMCAIVSTVFLPGSYCLYYGDEILTEGNFDPDSRRAFDWNRLQNAEISSFAEKLKLVLALKRQPAIKSGKVRLYAQDGLFVTERYTDGQKLTLKVCRKAVKIKPNGAIKYNTDEYFNDYSFVIEGELV